MPYIPQADRIQWDCELRGIAACIEVHGISNGELNYLMTKLGIMYVARHGTSYNTLSDVIKAFECAKLEFYRRYVAPYEDEKIKQHGDVL